MYSSAFLKSVARYGHSLIRNGTAALNGPVLCSRNAGFRCINCVMATGASGVNVRNNTRSNAAVWSWTERQMGGLNSPISPVHCSSTPHRLSGHLGSCFTFSCCFGGKCPEDISKTLVHATPTSVQLKPLKFITRMIKKTQRHYGNESQGFCFRGKLWPPEDHGDFLFWRHSGRLFRDEGYDPRRSRR